jgi:threonine/homoserine/homoserine lactone efflux protein
MISLTAALGMAAVALALVLTPGPNMMYLVSRSISQGRRAGLISLGGVAVGFAVYLVAAVLGLAAVFTAVPALYTGVKIAGALYLGWLAWKVLRPGGHSPFEARDLPRDRAGRLFTMGLATNLLNPKIALLYVALLPQFLDPSAGGIALQSLQLGAVQIAIALAVNALIVVAAGAIGSFLARRPLWMRAQRLVTGGALAAIAVTVAFDRSRPAV